MPQTTVAALVNLEFAAMLIGSHRGGGLRLPRGIKSQLIGTWQNWSVIYIHYNI